jgi:CRP/FNR family cyclic AMP-dependent transcriptional regulator
VCDEKLGAAGAGGCSIVHILSTTTAIPAKKTRRVDVRALLESGGLGKRAVYSRREVIFSQGDPCDSVMYVRSGAIELSVIAHSGREAIVATLGPGDFLGEGALAGHPVRVETASATMPTTVFVIPKPQMIRLLHSHHAFSDRFIAHMLVRNGRLEADLVDQLFNSSERRLARVLLLLARDGREEKPQRLLPKISQETLAEMVGTTRSRVNFFMNKFKKLGFIDYNDSPTGGLTINPSLLSVVVHD